MYPAATSDTRNMLPGFFVTSELEASSVGIASPPVASIRRANISHSIDQKRIAGNEFSQKIAGATFADNDVRSRTVSILDRRSLRQNSAQLPTIKVDLQCSPTHTDIEKICTCCACDYAVLDLPNAS